MDWKGLLAQGRVEKEKTSNEELRELSEVAARNLKDALLPGLSSDGKFGMAYNAARVLATIAVRASGYRVKSTFAGHYNTFLAMEAALGKEYASLAAYFDSCRKKRHELSYDAADIVTDTEVEELLGKVLEFRDELEIWLSGRTKSFKAKDQ